MIFFGKKLCFFSSVRRTKCIDHSFSNDLWKSPFVQGKLLFLLQNWSMSTGERCSRLHNKPTFSQVSTLIFAITFCDKCIIVFLTMYSTGHRNSSTYTLVKCVQCGGFTCKICARKFLHKLFHTPWITHSLQVI